MTDDTTEAGPGAPEHPGRPTCRCGYDRHHIMVSKVPKYGLWKGFWVIFMGVSAAPYRIDFRCRVCNETFDSTDDPRELKDLM